MSIDECEINYDGLMEDFDEEIVNPPTIYYVQNTYQEIKEIIWKKNYKEIEQDYIHVKQQLDGAVNFSKETFGKNRKGKIFLCTAITPTKAGEEKTTIAISLADSLALLKKNVVACLREPSLGPVFVVKGGGAGGGESTLYPEDDINLHFTGDIHAITSDNNLIVALIDNELYQHSELNFEPDRIVLPRNMDMNDSSLRDIIVARNDSKTKEHHSSFCITVASEVMAIFCLSKNEEDFLNRVEDIAVDYSLDNKLIFVKDLNCSNALDI